MRWLTLACALLFATVITAQAAHLHKPATSDHHVQAPGAGAQSLDDEEHCPLCVAAVHLASPTSIRVGLSPTVLRPMVVGTVPNGSAREAWTFARFSRPPPARG